jgi:hypothetical protein
MNVDETNMAEELITLILDWQDAWPVGSELIARTEYQAPGQPAPADPVEAAEAERAVALRRAAAWAHRDLYNDEREESLRLLLAQVKVSLSDPNRDRREALEHFREQMETESQRIQLLFLELQEQGPVSLDS